MTMTSWPFSDAENVATFTTSHVIEGAPILRVYREWEDGSWQFMSKHGADLAEAKIVCLKEIFQIDPSIGVLADLPCGWMAFRVSRDKPWIRTKNHSFPEFKESGYYLEDAVWLHEQLPDQFQIPANEDRESLQEGDHAKLVFRFADEMADRQDNECERMWMKVTTVLPDEAGYIGTLDNDPKFNRCIVWGCELHFHPNHVLQISRAED